MHIIVTKGKDVRPLGLKLIDQLLKLIVDALCSFNETCDKLLEWRPVEPNPLV